MFKTIVTLMRGRAFDAEQQLKDQNALALLDQQMRDAAGGVERLRRSLATATAHQNNEERRLTELRAQIADLEMRAVEALKAGREELAEKAAKALAELEADVVAATAAQEQLAVEVAKRDALLKRQTRRLAALERGRRLARAAQAGRPMRGCDAGPAGCFENTLAEAEETLDRLRETQTTAEATEAAFDALSADARAESIAETLSKEGFGPAKTPRAADILARLRAQAKGN